MRRMWRAALVLGCLHFCGAGARAQDGGGDTEARVAFEEGAAAFANGHYRVALEKFTRSHALSGRPALLFNIGLAHDRLREDELALRAFERYLEAVPDAANRAEVDGRVAELRRAIEARAGATPVEGGGSILEEWWLWAIFGAVVVGGVIAVVVLTGGETQDPLLGNTGEVSHAVLAW